jgi:hypothetical protein
MERHSHNVTGETALRVWRCLSVIRRRKMERLTRAAEKRRKSLDRRSHFQRSVIMAITHHFDYPAEKARQGAIILHKPWQRVVFFGGLALPVILLLFATLFPGVLH